MKFIFIFLFSVLSCEIYDVTVVGGGPAGLTAGLYAARLGLKTLVVAGEIPGGQLTGTSLVENFPGFVEGIDGALLIGNMRRQAEKYGALIKEENAESVSFTQFPYILTLGTKEKVRSRTIIIATGAFPRRLGLLSEGALFGKGVSTCAVCDASLYKGKKVVVIGGGDSAFEEALLLSRFASKVTMVHRSGSFKAQAVLRERVMKTENIEIKTHRTVKEICDPEKGFVTGIIMLSGGVEEKLACDGVFLAIGHEAGTGWLLGSGILDGKGRIAALPRGVFSAGDVADEHYRQAITAAGSGCKAALDAYYYLQNQENVQ